jgi:hypothetical protein
MQAQLRRAALGGRAVGRHSAIVRAQATPAAAPPAAVNAATRVQLGQSDLHVSSERWPGLGKAVSPPATHCLAAAPIGFTCSLLPGHNDLGQAEHGGGGA